MSDRLQEIRARLDAAGKEAIRAEPRVSLSGPVGTATITYGTTNDALREFSTHAPADIAWLLGRLDFETRLVADLEAQLDRAHERYAAEVERLRGGHKS